MSDTASLNPDADRSGPLIRELLQVSSSHHQPKFTCDVHAIVPDDKAEIRNIIVSWVMHRDVDWIVTTGGTGFGVRDCTPEVRQYDSCVGYAPMSDVLSRLLHLSWTARLPD